MGNQIEKINHSLRKVADLNSENEFSKVENSCLKVLKSILEAAASNADCYEGGEKSAPIR